MNGTQPQPAPAKLSDAIARMLADLEGTEALTGAQVGALVEFLRRHLPDLKTFAADFEFADALPSPTLGPALCASAAARLYLRMTAPSAPLLAVRPSTAQLIDLDAFRRPPAGGAS